MVSFLYSIGTGIIIRETMSTSKSKPKTNTSSVSALKSTNNILISKTSNGGASSTTTKPSKFYFACRNNDVNRVTSLLPTLTLEEINQTEPNGSTALHAAAYYGHHEIVSLLLSKGAQRMIKNIHGCTPYDEAKTEDIKQLFQRSNTDKEKSGGRFVNNQGPSYEWIFVKGDPSSYAAFNRESLLRCSTDEDFNRLCRGIRQHYINENGPLANEKDIEKIRVFFDKAIKDNDPTQIVRAYTAHTGFYSRINKDLSQIPTHWSGSKHERNFASILVFYHVFENYSFTGETYRGSVMSLADLNEYVIGTVFMNKTFLSTSEEREEAETFANSKTSSKTLPVICKYLIKNCGTALGIKNISEYPLEMEVLILPYAVFKVKSIQKLTGKIGSFTEIEVEEDDEMKWTLKKSHHTSQTHSSVKKKTTYSQNVDDNNDDDDNSYEKMFKDSQEKGEIDPVDLAKWKKDTFGIDDSTDTYAKIWNDAKNGKISKSDLAKWKQENGIKTKYDDSDLESYDGENNPTVFTASNHQSYGISKTFRSEQPFDMKTMMKQFENDNDNQNNIRENFKHFIIYTLSILFQIKNILL